MPSLKNIFNPKVVIGVGIVMVSSLCARSANADLIVPGDYKFTANAIVIADDPDAPSLGLIDVGTELTLSGMFNTDALDASRDRSGRVNQFTSRDAVTDFGLSLIGDPMSAISLRPNRAANLTFENNPSSDLFRVVAGNSPNLWVSSGDFADLSSIPSFLFFQAGDTDGTAFTDATDGFDGLNSLVNNPRAFDVFLLDLENQNGEALATFSVNTASFQTVSTAAVPEPGALGLFALACVMGLAYRGVRPDYS